MASLGKLWFELGMRDKTDKDIAEIRKGVEKRLKDLNVDIGLNGDSLRRSIEAALTGKQFKVDILVDKANATKAVQDALAKAGYTTSIKPDDVRAARIAEINRRISNAYDESRAKAEKLQEQIKILRARYERATSSANKYSGALGGITKNMRTQFNLAVQLRNQLANIYSIYAAERFLTSIIEIGGEFQKQRVALQTMFQDAQKADVLFGQIKELAVESPFEFKELAGYTKQLAAFNIPYEEMYDTTKRLADISAGVGVDMGRIILAYGQVRSAEFLKGTELRQFTEAGIPLLQQLADKFSELEGRVVSVGEVFDKISTRQVSFQMVKDVLWDLTNEGGQFYNMQGALADTLAGKLSNLRDAYDVMLADIAESNNSTLSSGLDLLTDTMNNWEKLSDIILTAAAAYGTYKAALVVLTVAEKAYQSVQMSSVLLNRTQAMLNAIRATQGLTAATKAQIIVQRGLNAVMKANPIVLVASALAALVGSYVLFSDGTKSTTEIITGLNESLGDLQNNFEELSHTDMMIEEYEELSQKQNKTAEESKKLNTITTALYEKFGGAIEVVDEYGNAIGLSAERMRELNKQQRQNIIDGMNVELKEADERAEEVRKKIEKLTNQIRTGSGRAYVGKGLEGGIDFGYITDEDIDNFKKQRKDYQDELLKLEDSAKKTRDFLNSLGETEGGESSETVFSGWRKSIADFVSGNKLLKDLTPKETEEYVDWFNRLKDAISEAKEDLAKMNGTTGLFDDDTVKQQQEYVSALERLQKKFNISLGEGGSGGKDWSEVLRQQMSQLQSERVSAELQLEQAVINSMSEGGDKELAQLRLNHRKRMAEIEKQKDDLVDKAREAEKAQWMQANPGAKESSFVSKISGVGNLPKEFQDIVSGLIKTENELYKKSIEDYYTNIAKEFQGYLEKRKAVEEEYARKRAALFQSGASSETIQEADYQEQQTLQRIDAEFAQRERTFREWASQITNIGLEELRRMLMEAEAQLRLAEINASVGNASGTDLAVARAKVVKIREQLESLHETDAEGSKKSKEGWEDTYKVLEKVNRSFEEIGDSVGGVAGDIIKQAGKMAGSILQVVNSVNVLKAGFKGLESASPLLAGISAGLSVITGIIGLFDRTDYMEEFREEAEKLNDELHKVKENARIDSGAHDTIFGNDAWANATDNISAANDALERYETTMKEISQRKIFGYLPKIFRGLRNGLLDNLTFDNVADSLKNMQVQIRHSTWFRSAKYMSLAYAAPELFNSDDTVNMDALAEFVDSDMFQKLSEENQQYLQDMLDNWSTYEDALSSVKDYLTDIFGDLGDTMMDALVDAFENGTDAAEAFTDSVSDMLEQMAKNMIYSVTLGPLFEQAQEDMLAIMGDEAKSNEEKFSGYTAIMQGLISDALAQQGLATNLMKEYQDMAEKAGLEIFTPEKDEEKQTGLSASIQGVTEDTANLLGSYLSAIRHDVSVNRQVLESIGGNLLPTMSVTAQAQLQQLNAIAQNTLANANAAVEIQKTSAEIRTMLGSVITAGSGGKAIRMK